MTAIVNATNNAGISVVSDNSGALAMQVTGTTALLLDTTTNAVVTSTTTSSSTTTGALVVKGGVGIGGDVYVNGNVVFAAGSPVLNVAASGYNVAKGTVAGPGPTGSWANVDNVAAAILSNGFPTVQAINGSLTFYSAATMMLSSGAIARGVNTGQTISVGISGNIGATGTLVTGGDTIMAVVQDQTLKRVYRITYMQTAGPSSGTVINERIL
jgi:hypothetical protein